MKRVFILSIIMLAFATITSYSQTYCFKHVEAVQNGVKSRGSGSYQYLTFQNDMNSFYVSDASGYSSGPVQLVYRLVSTANNRYKYQQQGPMGPIANYYTFNSDFSRANATSAFLPNTVDVWQQVDGVQEEDEEFY